MNLTISLNTPIEEDEVIALYTANEWSSAQKPKALLAALRNSHSLVVARVDGELVGITNAISDSHLVVYYPHMLVLPKFQGKKIGQRMMEMMQEVYGDFHQQMLTADGKAIDFYKKLGFSRAGNTEPMWIYDGDDH